MKLEMKLKMVVGALAFGLANAASALPIETTPNGSGLWFSLASETASYTRSLGLNLDGFNSTATTPGFSLSYNADATLTSFLAGVADKTTLFWHVGAVDSSGFNRVITTFSEPLPAVGVGANNIRSATATSFQMINGYNEKLAVNDSATYTAADNGFANRNFGVTPYMPQYAGLLNFDTRTNMGTGTSAAGVIRIDGNSFGTAASTYTRYFDPNAMAIQFSLQQNGNLQVSAVPEPDTYALLLAGLGLVGFIARRRLKHTA